MAANTTSFFLDTWVPAPSVPGVFTSPTLDQKVDESILVSWGASSGEGTITYDLYRDDVSDLGAIVVTDNGDGTWTAVPNPDSWISVDANQMFTAVNAEAKYLDEETYTFQSTTTQGTLLGSTTETSLLVDTSAWLDDSTVRLRVRARNESQPSGFRYSEYFIVKHKESLYIGPRTAAILYVGHKTVSELYVGSAKRL